MDRSEKKTSAICNNFVKKGRTEKVRVRKKKE